MTPNLSLKPSLRRLVPHHGRQRRGNIILMSAWVIMLAFAFAAFTIDIGYISVCKAQLQAAVDAATLAGAMELDSNASQADIATAVKDAVEEIAGLNPVATWPGLLLDRDADIELGRREWDAANGTYTFRFGPDATPYNIVRVTGRYGFVSTSDGSGSADRRIPVFFSPAIGQDKVSMNVSSVATFQPRDVMLVQDYSGSMNDDTEFKSVGSLGLQSVTDAITQMWHALDDPTYGDLPFEPQYLTVEIPSTGTGYPALNLTYRGTAADVTSTLALSKVKLDFDGGGSQEFTGLTDTVGTFTGTGGNSGRRIDQVRIWSGKASDKKVPFDDAAIAQWLNLNNVGYPYPSGSWLNLINYVNTSSYVNQAGFRYQYSTMCLINYWNEQKAEYTQTPVLWKCPTQPLEAAKNAADVMIDYIQEVSADDRVGLSIYTHPNSAGAILESGLTSDLDSVKSLYRHRQASHYDAMTNIGAGMKIAREELESNARPEAFRMVVLMTDGVANRPGGYADWYALNQASLCQAADIRVMTVSLGLSADTSLMQQIADITGGKHFNVPGGGTIAEYEAQLKDVFREIAADRPLRLLPAVNGN